MEHKDIPIRSGVNEFEIIEDDDQKTYVYATGYDHKLSDDIFVFLSIYEGGNEKFVEFGYTTDLENVGNIKLPYGGEVLFFARNIPFWRLVGFEKRDPIFKSDSKLSLLKYKPLLDFPEGKERLFLIDSIPIFRRFFKKLDGFEVNKEELIELKENVVYRNDEPWVYHIDSPEEREENKKYDKDCSDPPCWPFEPFDPINDGQY
jgi:hypothetical protein